LREADEQDAERQAGDQAVGQACAEFAAHGAARGDEHDGGQASGADAVILTPSHQWPTGSVLSARNRAAATGWATDRNAFITEDDYDAEYRYDRTPVGPRCRLMDRCTSKSWYGGPSTR
jgi:DNA-binding transcriptional MocR family regulator